MTRIRAKNAAGASQNPIHRDAEAQAYGFRGGMVGGMSLYAYLSVPALLRWGDDWVERGGAETRFRRPVYDGEELRLRTSADVTRPARDDPALSIDLVDSTGEVRASGDFHLPAVPPPTPSLDDFAVGQAVEPRPVITHDTLVPLPDLPCHRLIAEEDGDIAAALEDETSHLHDPRLVHPKQLAIASIGIMYEAFDAEGPRIHVGLVTQQHRAVEVGTPMRAVGRVLETWRRKGRTYATNDVLVLDANDTPVMHVRNTTIWQLRPPLNA